VATGLWLRGGLPAYPAPPFTGRAFQVPAPAQPRPAIQCTKNGPKVQGQCINPAMTAHPLGALFVRQSAWGSSSSLIPQPTNYGPGLCDVNFHLTAPEGDGSKLRPGPLAPGPLPQLVRSVGQHYYYWRGDEHASPLKLVTLTTHQRTVALTTDKVSVLSKVTGMSCSRERVKTPARTIFYSGFYSGVCDLPKSPPTPPKVFRNTERNEHTHP
jgi:hypothetical protein